MKKLDRFYIDGKWTKPAGTDLFELINPATEEAYGHVTLGNAEDVDRAVVAARRAFASFSQLKKEWRMEILSSIVESLLRRESDLMDAVTEEMGAPSSLKGQTGTAVQAFRQAIVTLRDYSFEHMLGDNVVRREPIGVCGLISAWNWPLQLMCQKLASAFAAGCTVVAKPSEFTPLSAVVLAEALDTAGLPPGVFNLVNGDGPTVGEAISRHPGIDMVSFTGSTRAGVMVAQAAAGTVKRVCQELGGKSANIILPDADLAAAARFNVSRGFSNTGQSCHSPTRMLVSENQADELIALIREEAQSVKVGDPKNPRTTIGPVVNRAQFERVQHFIERGIEEGAKVVTGGPGRPEDIKKGFFIRPTVFSDVRPDMSIAQEEIFGPVLSVITYRDIDDAVEIANGTRYGLGGYIFSSNVEKARQVAERMQAGRIFLNGAPSNNVAPMGGYKQSGNGREMGVFGLEEYLEVKAMLGFASSAG
ncbi:aldehyde dehydrogenase family protein [Paraburkholderia sp. Tr-20389]|uniref:aldehyde dehydrogenase family protein n=1 Tax=Paraburkholderia sp. Tr-20389 TaxID=2703903 RepID=UPI00197E5B87|nr:aldehyde dehydrogenase family protein [Paraburkholderia sp. Tr-20389]MBN3756458.1 aldehyde dehydrogenase family protein [Paraburkholderia sp. Tr-20389]